MVDDLVTAYGNRLLVAALGVSLAMLCLFAVLWVLKKRSPSPFIRGGRSRQQRLQVLDAAAVDARRRLVLVRRDNVEHLIMIGGPTDVVIESRISDGESYVPADIEEEAPQQIAPPPAARQVPQQAKRPALPRAERQRPAPAAQPAAAATRAAGRQQPAAAHQQEQHYDVGADEDADNSFFYDEFYDEEASEEEEIADLLEATRGRVFNDREPPAAPVPPPRPAQPPQPAALARQQRPAPSPQNFSSSDFERVLEEEIAMHLTNEAPAGRAPPRPVAPPARTPIAPARPMAPPLMARPSEPRPSEIRQPETRQPEPRSLEERRPVAPPTTSSRPLPQPTARPITPPPARTPPPSRAGAGAAPARSSAQPNLQNEIARIFGEMSPKREK